MKVVGICGSPRKGNSEWMLRKLLEGLPKLRRRRVVPSGTEMGNPGLEWTFVRGGG